MSNEKFEFAEEERAEALQLIDQLREAIADSLCEGDEQHLHQCFIKAMEENRFQRDIFGLNPILLALQTAKLAVTEIGLKRDGVFAILHYSNVISGYEDIDHLSKVFGDSVGCILRGLCRIHDLYKKNPIIESENFRNLLLSFAEDMRVILIMIADRVNLMRQIRDTSNLDAKRQVSEEASYLYAPLAHKLGLYKLKSELEDLSLKYLETDAYYMIKENLNATKRSRDAYIERFITPLKAKLDEAGLVYHMKGRTKSIHSIWQKMKKQQCGFDKIYDLFAIRIILDSPLDKEKMLCWQTFSIVTDMYQPNPKRLRDWLSMPKSNGYECLHITVLGPEGKWVEVQIRTQRMDDIAEHGLAAHWRYKGVKSEGNMDTWLASIRSALEAGDDLQVMDQFKMNLQDEEVYVFTPKGDLFKFSQGATVLDFAYYVHTAVGNSCIGARLNGRIVSIRETLHSGDTIEILTQNNQRPKPSWLGIVKTPKAKAKVKLALKETQAKEGLLAREMLERRFKNRKIEIDETLVNILIRKMGFKERSDFYRNVADGKLDINTIIEKYVELRDHQSAMAQQRQIQSAEEFNYDGTDFKSKGNDDDVLVIDRNLKGIEYSLARCCSPIYGDDIFGFVTINGGIKIHRTDCPNAPELRRRFGYRFVKARWSGKGNSQYSVTLRIIGNDDIGIVSNITNIISKEERIVMRSINIDSHDGLFSGNLVVMIDDTSRMASLIKKLQTVKGVKSVARL